METGTASAASSHVDLEPSSAISESKRNGVPRRDRDWQTVTVGASVVAMLIFEMFHSPPCDLGSLHCSGGRFTAKIGINLFWGTLIGFTTGVALAAVMALLVDALDARRTGRSIVPLVRTLLAVAGVVILFVAVLIRFRFVRS